MHFATFPELMDRKKSDIMEWTQTNPKLQEGFSCQSKKGTIPPRYDYALKNRGISVRKQHEQRLLRILISFHEKHPAAGLDALVHMIKPICPCSRNTLHRLMKLHNIHSIRKRAYKITTNSKHSYAVSPNLLQRNFTAHDRNARKRGSCYEWQSSLSIP